MKLTDAEKAELREHIEFERAHAKRTGLEDPTCGVHADVLESLLDELESLRSINKGLSDKCELLFREDEAREEVTQTAEEAAIEAAIAYEDSLKCSETEGFDINPRDAFLAGARWGRGGMMLMFPMIVAGAAVAQLTALNNELQTMNPEQRKAWAIDVHTKAVLAEAKLRTDHPAPESSEDRFLWGLAIGAFFF